MNAFETFFLDRGMSYTLSKLLPYILMPVLGLIVWLIAKRWMKKGWLKLAAFVVFLLLPFGLYFISNPIYEGDFANNAEEITKTPELQSIPATKLLVITIPGCPFCMESIGKLREMKLRNPNVKIEYRVCTKEAAALKDYKEAANGEFPIKQAKNPEELMNVAKGSFPTFVLIKKNSASMWSNDNFGAGAMDEVVARFE